MFVSLRTYEYILHVTRVCVCPSPEAIVPALAGHYWNKEMGTCLTDGGDPYTW